MSNSLTLATLQIGRWNAAIVSSRGPEGKPNLQAGWKTYMIEPAQATKRGRLDGDFGRIFRRMLEF